jgi:putative Ca2+/H+ antiporter (TMEM165/GDT1 family)
LSLEPFFTSTVVVAVGEIGDKTQLLAIVLAATFKRPIPIILGILAATLLNHTIAAAVGYYVSDLLNGQPFRILVGAGFLIMAAWALKPDEMEHDLKTNTRGGVFIATLISFFLVEIGDKTQIATTLLAARYHQIALVTAGTTSGMLLADVPAVLLGEAATRIVPLKYVRWAAAAMFSVIGAWVLLATFGVV